MSEEESEDVRGVSDLTKGAIALFIGALLSGELQILLTVVTTVAGILAGFVSGRASSGESST